jgi:transcriptional regulator with XRE-family HTH domain
VFAYRMREVRGARGWTQQRLSDEMRALGRQDLARSTLAKIETGATRAQNISLEDVLAICAALDVSPIDMLTPRDPSDEFAVAPEVSTYAGAVRGWWRGWWPLRDTDDRQFFYGQAPVDEMADRVARGRDAQQRGEGAAAPDFYAAEDQS